MTRWPELGAEPTAAPGSRGEGEQPRGTGGPREACAELPGGAGRDGCPQSGMGTCWRQERISEGLWAKAAGLPKEEGRLAGL